MDTLYLFFAALPEALGLDLVADLTACFFAAGFIVGFDSEKQSMADAVFRLPRYFKDEKEHRDFAREISARLDAAGFDRDVERARCDRGDLRQQPAPGESTWARNSMSSSLALMMVAVR